MECCGEDREGNFCSECGKALSPGEVSTLLKHIGHQITKLSKEMKYFGEGHKLCASAKKRRDRWTSWKRELTRLVELDNRIKKSEGKT